MANNKQLKNRENRAETVFSISNNNSKNKLLK